MLLRINPRHPIHQLRDEMDRLLAGFVGRSGLGAWPFASRGRPATNLWEAGDTLTVEMEVPGVKPDQLDISVVGGELSIQATRPAAEPADVRYHRRERPTGEFHRLIRLPADVDADKVQAVLRDGVLTISLPKAESAKPRKIEVAPNS